MSTRLFFSDGEHRRPRVRAANVATALLVGFAAACWMVLAHAGSAAARVTSNTVTDAEILGTYIQVNGFDVETALLGRFQASSTTVRELATRVSSDHVGVRQAAFELAAKCSVAPVLAGSRVAAALEHDRAMTTLATLSGDTFDKAYLQYEAAFHRSTIDAVRQVLQPSTRCPARNDHCNAGLPAFERHLSETQALLRELPAR